MAPEDTENRGFDDGEPDRRGRTTPSWEEETRALPTLPTPGALFDETVAAFDLLPEDPGTGELPAPRSGGPVVRGDGTVPNSGGIHVPERGDTLYDLFGTIAAPAGRSTAPSGRPADDGAVAPPPPGPPPAEVWPFSGVVPEISAPSGGPTRQEIRLVSLVTIAALIALVAIFFLGVHLAAGAVPVAAPSTPAAAPSPSVTPLPSAARTSGTAGWQRLAGGECFTPFTSGWAKTFTIVDCAGPHQAQLVYATLLPGTISASYPGVAKVVSEAQKICGQNGVIDLAAAHDDVGVQVQATYPVDASQWDSGSRAVYCFATLSSGDSIVGNIAGTPAGDALSSSGQ